MNAIHSRHAAAHFRFGAQLAEALKLHGSALQGFSNPSTGLSDLSLPEPDLVVAEPHDAREPLPLAKVRLAIEISDATLDTDLGRKALLYASYGIPEYCVVDLDNCAVHQMWAPGPEGYGQRRRVTLHERVEAVTITALTVATGGV